MTLEEIRKNAPKGATHYRIIRSGRDVKYYMRPPYGLVMIYYYGCWEISEEWHGEYDRFIKPL